MKYITREDEFSVLPLSKRLSNCLHRSGLHTIDAIINYSQTGDWNKIPNMGNKSIEEIENWLKVILTGETGYLLLESGVDVFADQVTQTTPNVVLDIPIADMELAPRAKNALLAAGIHSAQQLIGKTEEDLLSIKNLGLTSVKDIIRIMEGLISESSDSLDKSDAHSQLADELRVAFGGTHSAYLREILDIQKKYPEAQGETLYYRLYESGILREKLKQRILNLLETNVDGMSQKSLFEKLPGHLGNTTIIEEALLELEMIQDIALGEIMVVRKYPSITWYLSHGEDNKYKDIIRKRLNGYTLEKIGTEYGVQRERIRQIINREIKKLRLEQPRFDEDKYLYLFEKYNISAEDFKIAFDEPDSTYVYLEMVSSGDKTRCDNLEEALQDSKISIPFKKQLEKAIYKKYITVDGIRVKKERRSLVRHFVRTRCREITKYDDFFSQYNDWIADLDLQSSGFSLESRTYENILNAAEYVLWNQWRRFRYYDIEGNEYGALLEGINLSQYENVQLSSLKFFRDNPELMREYDIRDEYELHNLLKKIWPKEDTLVAFKKMPTVEIGKPNKDDQVLSLLLQYAPISAEDLAAKYEDTYGIKAATVLANYLQDLDDYYFDGVYSIDANNLQLEQFQRMRDILTAEYYSVSDIKRIYHREFPQENVSQINPYTLKTLGFRVYSDYVIKNTYLSAAEYFNKLLTTEDIIDARDFAKSLSYVQAYTGEVYRLKHNREIVEFAPHQFINIRRLNACGISVEDMEEYCKAVCSFTEIGEFFTIESLKKDGFVHTLDDLGFEEWFYASVLLEDRENFSVRRIGGTKIFVRGTRRIMFSDMLTWLLESQKKIDIYDLRDLLETRYGVVLSKDKIIEIIRNTDMYYDTIMEAVYIDYETYFEEV